MRTNFVSVHAAAAAVAVVLALGGATAATAAPGSLQGRYGLSGMGACLASPKGVSVFLCVRRFAELIS